MGRSRALRATRDSIAKKAGHRFHLSTAKSREVVLPFLERIFSAASGRGSRVEVRQRAGAIAHELELTPEEVGFLLGTEPDSRAVTEILAGSAPVAPPVRSEDEETPTRPGPTVSDGSGEPPKRVQRQLSDFGNG
jgi:hypothetical protein